MSRNGEWRAKRSLGQNFLVDPNLQRKIVAALDAGPEHTVLEVGPGHGELTGHLVGHAGGLVLVEKDRELAAELEGRWGGRQDVRVIEGDALVLDLRAEVGPTARLRVVSNVPYNITSPLLFAFLDLDPPAERIVVMVQKEVAQRIVAAPGGKTYGALSVGVQAGADAEICFDVSRAAFRPVPDVDSAVVAITPRPGGAGVDAERLRVVTRACFNRRRKQLQKILRTAPELAFAEAPEAILERLDIDPVARPETLEPAVFVELAMALR